MSDLTLKDWEVHVESLKTAKGFNDDGTIQVDLAKLALSIGLKDAKSASGRYYQVRKKIRESTSEITHYLAEQLTITYRQEYDVKTGFAGGSAKKQATNEQSDGDKNNAEQDIAAQQDNAKNKAPAEKGRIEKIATTLRNNLKKKASAQHDNIKATTEHDNLTSKNTAEKGDDDQKSTAQQLSDKKKFIAEKLAFKKLVAAQLGGITAKQDNAKTQNTAEKGEVQKAVANQENARDGMSTIITSLDAFALGMLDDDSDKAAKDNVQTTVATRTRSRKAKDTTKANIEDGNGKDEVAAADGNSSEETVKAKKANTRVVSAPHAGIFSRTRARKAASDSDDQNVAEVKN